jgi:hypothetical protein
LHEKSFAGIRPIPQANDNNLNELNYIALPAFFMARALLTAVSGLARSPTLLARWGLTKKEVQNAFEILSQNGGNPGSSID